MAQSTTFDAQVKVVLHKVQLVVHSVQVFDQLSTSFYA